MKSDIRVREVQVFKAHAAARTPLSFGAVVVDEIPIGYARATVESRAGQIAEGWGAMFVMDLWPWPVSKASHETKRKLMCELLDEYARIVQGTGEFGHPIELFAETEAGLRKASQRLSERLTPGEQIPFLGVLVSASPVDHAIHDAFGKVNGIDSYRGHGPESMSSDMSRYLGKGFEGVYPSQFLRQDYLPLIPIFHLVGGLDWLHRSEVDRSMPQDGVPNSLDEWIERDGVFCLKVKLLGKDLSWDLERTAAVSRIYHETRDRARRDLPVRPYLTADFNEQCESPGYLVAYLNRLREKWPLVLDELLYIEQPTERDLEAHRWEMGEVAAIKPVLVDESLASVEDFHRALDLGWSGIALKSCKCLSSDLVLLCAAELAGVPYAVQDLTNPSLALIESVGLAARTHPIKGVEANSRQFFPSANELVAGAHPDLFRIRDGYARTRSMVGEGLGMHIDRVPGFVQALEAADAAFRAAQSPSQ